jgi:ketosteroid isomerase-like protein
MAMSEADIQAVRRFYSAWTDGNLPAMLDEVSADVEAQPVLGLLYERPAYRGHGGISRWFDEIKDLWEGFEAHVEEAREVDDAVIAFVRLVAHQGGRSSDARIGVVCHLRRGKIVSFVGRDADELADELARS